MKPLFLSLFFLFYSTNSQALSEFTKINTPNTVYEQLCELNKYWQLQENYSSLLSAKVDFTEHEDLIQLHLMLVEQDLRQKSTNHLSSLQKFNRTQALNILKQYWQQKQFPKNTHHTSITPYFIDDFNTACAVGHLMRESGAITEAQEIAQTMNNAYIEDIPLKKLQYWAEKMGFEITELKWIQPAYGAFAWEQTENADCHIPNGSIKMEVSLGVGCMENEDSYVWYDYSDETIVRIGNGKKLDSAPAGFYRFHVNLTATDVFQCSPNRFVAISDSEGPKIEAEIRYPDIDAEDGAIELNITNGVPPYHIEWYDFNETYLGNKLTLTNLKGYSDMMMQQGYDYTHRVKVTDANGCKSFENFYVYGFSNELPAPKFIPHIQNTIEGRSEGSIHIETSETLTYQWLHNPYLISETANNLAAGNYTVIISTENNQQIYIRHFEIIEEELTDIENHLVEDLSIYPTLVTEFVQIDLPSTESEYDIEVFDQSGRLVDKKEVGRFQPKILLQTQLYPKGMYFVSMSNEQGRYVGKFIRQ